MDIRDALCGSVDDAMASARFRIGVSMSFVGFEEKWPGVRAMGARNYSLRRMLRIAETDGLTGDNAKPDLSVGANSRRLN